MKVLDLNTIEPGEEISLKGLDNYETYAEGTCIFIRPKWIKCSDRMPPDDTDVLAYGFGHTSIQRITNPKDGNLWGCISKECVTHWMPLPKAPE